MANITTTKTYTINLNGGDASRNATINFTISATPTKSGASTYLITDISGQVAGNTIASLSAPGTTIKDLKVTGILDISNTSLGYLSEYYLTKNSIGFKDSTNTSYALAGTSLAGSTMVILATTSKAFYYFGTEIVGSVQSNNTLTGTSSADTVTGTTVAEGIYGLEGNDIINGGGGNDTIDGGTGDDTLNISGSYYNDGYSISYSDATQTFTVSNRIGAVLSVKNIEKISFLTDKTTTGYIGGTTGNDSLIGTSTGDLIFGGAGNDTLTAGTKVNLLIGGPGNDTYIIKNDDDNIEEAANEGTDSVQSSISFLLTDNIENLTLTGSAAINGTGNSLANLIIGNDGKNLLDGGGGNDTINGGKGDDVITVRAGYVHIDGGEGADTARFYSSFTFNNVDLYYSGYSNTIDASSSSGLYAHITNVEKFTFYASPGSVSYSIYTSNGNTSSTVNGSTSLDILLGGEGNDVLDGKAGLDYMKGGSGNDTYVVDNIGDVIVETYSGSYGGTDTVQSAITYTLASLDKIENLTLTGSAAINATGNTLANIITGNTGKNNLSGLDGNDTIIGNAGSDTMTGGSGNDTFKFLASTDSATNSADIIADFASDRDKVDLEAIDANTLISGNQAFTFINGLAFSKVAGQLRFANSVVFGDTNGDGKADFQITLTGLNSIGSYDFVL